MFFSGRKKKPAPPPPVFSIAEEREETSSTTSRTSKTLPSGTRLQECYQIPDVIPQAPPSPPVVELPVEPPQTKPIPPTPSRIPDCVDNLAPRGNAINPSNSLVSELKSVFSSFQERNLASSSAVVSPKRTSYSPRKILLKPISSIYETQKSVSSPKEISPPPNTCSVKDLINRFDSLNQTPVLSRQSSFRNKITSPGSPNVKSPQSTSPNSKLSLQISSPKQDISDSSSPGSSLSVSSVIFNFKFNGLAENVQTPPAMCLVKQGTQTLTNLDQEKLEVRRSEKVDRDRSGQSKDLEVSMEKLKDISLADKSPSEVGISEDKNLVPQVMESLEDDKVLNCKSMNNNDLASWLESMFHHEVDDSRSNQLDIVIGESQVELSRDLAENQEMLSTLSPNSLTNQRKQGKPAKENDKLLDVCLLKEGEHRSSCSSTGEDFLLDKSDLSEPTIPFIDHDDELFCCSSREKSMMDDESELKSCNDFHLDVSFVEDISTVDSRDIISTEEEEEHVSENKLHDLETCIDDGNFDIKSTIIPLTDNKSDNVISDIDKFPNNLPRVILKKESSSDTDASSEFSPEETEEKELDDPDSSIRRTKTVTFLEEEEVLEDDLQTNSTPPKQEKKKVQISPKFKLKTLKQHGKKLWNKARNKQKVSSSSDWLHKDVITQDYCSCEEPDIVYVRASARKCARTNAFKVKPNQKPLQDDSVLKTNELFILENQFIREKLKELLDSRPEEFL